MEPGGDAFDYGAVAVPELEAEPDMGGDADDDAIAGLVAQMMRAGTESSTGMGVGGAVGAASAAGAAGRPQARVELLPTVADDYIRNFLIRCGMRRSLDTFNTEWYELKSKGALPDDDVLSVPDIYAQHERLSDAVSRLRVELGHAQEIAGKAQAQWERLRRERDFHRMHHKRVVQEKNRLIVDMKRLKSHFDGFEPTVRELRSKYESVMRDRMLLKVERDKLAARVSSLEAQVAALEHAPQGAAGLGLGGFGSTVAASVGPAMKGSAAGGGATVAGRPRPSAAAGGSGTGALASVPHGGRTGMAAAGGRTRGGAGAGGAATSPSGGAGSSGAHAPAGRRAAGGRGGDAGAGGGAGGPLPEELPNPFAGLAFEPAHASDYSGAVTIKAHGAAVTGVAMHPTKPVLATVSDDTTWRLWSMPEGELIMTGEGHRTWCSDADFHPWGNHLATASGDGVVKVWDLASAACTATLADHTQTVWAVAWHSSGDFLLTASMDHTCRLFDLAGGAGRVRQTLRGHVDSVNAVVWQPFGAVAATCSGDKTVSLWDTRTALCVQTFYGHTNAVNDVAFTLRGDALASCDADGVVRVWDIRMVTERGSATVAKGQPVHSVAWDRSGSCLATGSEDGVVRVLDAGPLMPSIGAPAAPPLQLKSCAVLRGHADAVQAVAFDPTSSYLVSASNDATLRAWSDGGAMPDLRAAASAMSAALGSTGMGMGDDGLSPRAGEE